MSWICIYIKWSQYQKFSEQNIETGTPIDNHMLPIMIFHFKIIFKCFFLSKLVKPAFSTMKILTEKPGFYIKEYIINERKCGFICSVGGGMSLSSNTYSFSLFTLWTMNTSFSLWSNFSPFSHLSFLSNKSLYSNFSLFSFLPHFTFVTCKK